VRKQALLVEGWQIWMSPGTLKEAAGREALEVEHRPDDLVVSFGERRSSCEI